MNPKISMLTIEGFRSLRKLRIEGLGRVNLITGRNNTGKSSVLEALHIFASNAAPAVISRILRSREENVDESDGATQSAEGEASSMILSLFTGFPSLSGDVAPIVVSTERSGVRECLSLSIRRLPEENFPKENRHLLGLLDQWIPEAPLALFVDAGTGRKYLMLDTLRRFLLRPGMGAWLEQPRFPCVYISPYGPEHTSELGPLWDNVVLSDREKEVVEALRIITPDVDGVSMIGGDGPRRSRTAIGRSSSIPHPVPLRSFGDGLNRLFGIVLSLVNAKDGLLLIDEVENGMHYTVQLDLWRVIFRLARRLDIQVFATSHSWDSVETFQKAAKEDPDNGVLIRLSRKGEDIVPTVVSEDDLEIAIRDRIEVR